MSDRESGIPAHREYFVDAPALEAFERSFRQQLTLIQDAAVEQVLGHRNSQRFRHGGGWSAPKDSPSLPGKWKKASAELETKFDDLLNNDLNVLPRALGELSNAMHRQMMAMMYATISEACERTGNVVNSKEKASLEEAFLETLEKIEFSIGDDGQVRMPQLHVGEEMFTKFMDMKARETPEFAARVEALKARKTQEAHEREAARKARFVRYGE